MPNIHKAEYHDTIPNQLKATGNLNGNLDFKEMLHNKSVIVGFIAAIIGICLAFLSYILFNGNIRILFAFAGAAFTFTGTDQITKYINNITIQNEVNKSMKTRDDNCTS